MTFREYFSPLFQAVRVLTQMEMKKNLHSIQEIKNDILLTFFLSLLYHQKNI